MTTQLTVELYCLQRACVCACRRLSIARRRAGESVLSLLHELPELVQPVDMLFRIRVTMRRLLGVQGRRRCSSTLSWLVLSVDL